MTRQFDVLIAGAGMVGAAAAALLAQVPRDRALSIGVVEARVFAGLPPENSFDARVVAVTEGSRRLLEQIGAWRAIAAQRCCPYRRMSVRDSAGTGLIEFDCADLHLENLGHIVENSIIQGALLEIIDSLDNVQLLCPARIVGMEQGGPECSSVPGEHQGAVRLRLESGEILEAALLVAADGATSRVRDLAGFSLRTWPYRHSAIVCTIGCERAHGFTARQWFMDTGPLAFLPLRGNDGECRHLSIVWSQQEAEAQRLMALSEQDFCRELERASEHCLGRVESVARRFLIPLVQRHAVDYVQPGIALVGDSAHTIHPLAGQGVNLGFHDVRVLVEEIDRGLARGLSPGNASLLRRYQRRRKPENLAMMAAMEAFKGLFGLDLAAVRILRNEGMSRVNRLAPLKDILVRQAMGL